MAENISLCDSFMLVIDVANLILAIFKTRRNMTELQLGQSLTVIDGTTVFSGAARIVSVKRLTVESVTLSFSHTPCSLQTSGLFLFFFLSFLFFYLSEIHNVTSKTCISLLFYWEVRHISGWRIFLCTVLQYILYAGCLAQGYVFFFHS